MVKNIYFVPTDEGYLPGWSSTPSGEAGEMMLEVPEDHELLRIPEIYKIVDGVPVRDDARQAELLESVVEYPGEKDEIRALKRRVEESENAMMTLMAIMIGGVK